jgi:hypothetical protein
MVLAQHRTKQITRSSIMFANVTSSTVAALNGYLETVPSHRRDTVRKNTLNFLYYICWQNKFREFDILSFPFDSSHLADYQTELEKTDSHESPRLALKIQTARELIDYVRAYQR